ncbi:MAG: A/G-specific adenine glycosylase [Acidobacteria bacterium]|nr:A/G-specific adenine glycosylase [Acidobacteriota bacterium]
MNQTPLPAPAFAAALLEWYDQRDTPMPWRGSRDPYRIWLSEVMLQQTRIATVKDYYARFLTLFPTIEALAKASLDEVLKAWEGLGYYSRARNLHRLAQVVVNEREGQFPATPEALQQLPGIGRYTAAAIASIAFGARSAVLDGNVIRVLTRLMDLPDEIGSPRIEQQLWDLAEALLPAERCGDYNQALMDLGRLICVPRRPVCEQCPVQSFCAAFAKGTQHLRPVKKQKAPLPIVRAAAAVIRDAEGRLLLVQRPTEGLLGGLWMLPGGNCEDEEPAADCLRRVLQQTLNIEIIVGEEMAAITQNFTHFRLLLRAFACEWQSGTLPSTNNTAWAAEISQYSLGKADRQIITGLATWQPRLFADP